jgi:hypothetical protein
VRTFAVIFPLSGRDLYSRIEQVPEPAHVQAFIATYSMEALHTGILGVLAGADVYYVGLLLRGPLTAGYLPLSRWMFRDKELSHRGMNIFSLAP